MSDSFADNILDDDSLAPLKRNHACLQCKKRKVKCDAIKPVCSPCLRSHAHALRSAHRNNVAPPRCSCTYADTDTPPPSDDESPTTSHVQQAPRSDSHDSGATKKKGGQDAIKRVSEKKGPKSAIGSSRNLEREKEIRRDEEKDLLLARIAELERRLAGLTPADSNSTSNLPSIGGSQYSSPAGISHRQGSGSSAAANITVDSFGSSHINRPDIQQIWVQDNNKSTTVSNDVNNDWDLGGLFMVPANWPKQLPSAFLLEHLIETFFAHVPQLPHMLHRPSLLARVRLPPTSDKFPHPSLLHAICAYAASYTAWVHTFKPEETDNQVAEYKKTHDTLDDIPDFGLSQGEAAQRSIRLATQTCIVGPGTETVEMCQASIILCDLYFGRGFPMQAWILAGTPARLVKALELGNKNRPQRFKDPMLQAPATPIQREERLATVWLTFMLDANFSINSFWNGTMELDEVWCAFPAKWNDTNGENDYIEENPQTARSAGALIEHPVISAFTLSCKASTLISRSARMLRYWNQRDPVPGDDLLLLTSTPYHQLMNDIYTFQRNIPAQLSVHKLSDGSQLNADVLLAHLMPYIALGIIHEPFMEFSNSTAPCVDILKKAVLGATALVHCIPSNLDVTSIMSASFVFSLYTLGRLTLHLRERAAQVYDMDAALQHESDVSVFCNVLRRYGQRFTLGLMMAEFLEGYSIVVRGKDLKEIDWIEREACCEVSRKKANAPLKAFKIPSRVPTPPLHNSSSTGVTPPNPNAITPPDSNLSFNQLNALGTSSLFDFDMQGIPNLPPVDLTNSTTAEVDAYVQRMTAASTKDAISAPVDTTFNANFPYPTMPPASDPMLNPYSTVDQFTYGQAPAVDCTASDVDDVNRKWAPWLM